MRMILAAFAWVTTIGFAMGLVANAQAQSFPARPVSMIVTYPPGGPVDTVARIVTEHMRGTLGQPFVIENVGGAGGSLGVGRLARAAPNGYTIGIGDIGAFVLNGAVYALPYDLLTDFEPIALLATSPLLVLARNTMPAKDLKELIAWLKDNQGKVSQGHIGSGTLSHLCGLYMQSTAGAAWTFVPYRGAAAALQDLTGGQIDLICAAPGGGALPLARGGQIKAYAVMAPARLANAPEIPTADEAGLSGFHVSFWQAMWAPKGTPKEVIAVLNAAVVGALADTTVRGKFAELGQVIPPRTAQTPEALGALRMAEADKWWPIIKAAGIKPE
jgi:tripartite-type tricarboxylate transporter receptor subunit TctC